MLHRIPIPLPAVVLVVASVASDIFPSLAGLSVRTDQRIVTIALAFILFHGGMHIGARRLRPVLAGVIALGVLGTMLTAAAVAVTAWGLFDFTTRQALLVGAALAPTDPAVVFSLLGKRKLPGRASTLLEGESGANDPIGIALMITVLDAHWHGASTVLDGAGKFALELGVGAAFGLLGGLALLYGIRHIRVPWWVAASLTLPIALGLYWVCAVAHGSGFLGVFVAGIVIGDEHKERITRITGRVSSLAEIVAFVVLGLSVEFADIWHHGHIPAGAGLAAVLVLLVRPLLVGLVLWPVRLGRAERVFVLWAGFKGAVPILLGTLILEHGVAGGQRIYDVVFVVVLLSVIVQGMLLPLFTRRLPEADDLS